MCGNCKLYYQLDMARAYGNKYPIVLCSFVLFELGVYPWKQMSNAHKFTRRLR